MCLLICTVIWGSAFVAQSVGMDYIGPFTFQTVRCAMATLGMLPVIAIADRFKNDHRTFLSRWNSPALWRAGILCGIALFFACNLQQLGIVDAGAGKSAFLTAMYIVIVPLIGLFLKKPITIWVPVGVGLAVAGLYCLTCVGENNFGYADLMLLICALMFAIQITIVDLYARQVDPLRLNAIQAFVCTVLSAGIMCFTETPDAHAIIDCLWPLAYAGLLSMGAAYALQIVGQKDLPPAAASLIMSLESAFAVLFGWLFLDEVLNFWQGLGCVLVFVAVVVAQFPDRKSKRF